MKIFVIKNEFEIIININAQRIQHGLQCIFVRDGGASDKMMSQPTT